ncbi:hypothetical protein RB195_017600 [Necator americanus]|uniref:Uncharacterized protein n=1 Tax=Necator americanus TaxID=51031 RepID=A0ABR1C5Z3_NECAM
MNSRQIKLFRFPRQQLQFKTMLSATKKKSYVLVIVTFCSILVLFFLCVIQASCRQVWYQPFDTENKKALVGTRTFSNHQPCSPIRTGNRLRYP